MAAGADSIRKRSRSYRARINSFSIPLRSKAPCPHPPAPSSPVSQASPASSASSSSPSPSAPPDIEIDIETETEIAPIPPPITTTTLTQQQIIQLTHQLARQSSHQLSQQTRYNTKKNAGPLPFVAAVHRVLRRIRSPPSSPISSTTTSTQSASSSDINNNIRNNHAPSASAPASSMRPKSLKTVSFSQTITILSSYRKADKWVQRIEKSVLPLPNLIKYPSTDSATRRRSRAGRRASIADLPSRTRSDMGSREARAQSERIRPVAVVEQEPADPAAFKRRANSNVISSTSSCTSNDDPSPLSLLRRRSTPRVVSTHSASSCTDSENLTDSDPDLKKTAKGTKHGPTTNARTCRPLFAHFRVIK